MLMPAMLATTNLQRLYKLSCGPSDICWSFKLDGVRTFAALNDFGKAHYVSRANKTFNNFGCFDDELAVLGNLVKRRIGKIPVFDGEVMAEGGTFSQVMEQVHRKTGVDDSALRYHIFDFQHPDMPLQARLNVLAGAFAEYEKLKGEALERLRLVQHYTSPEYTSDEAGVKQLTEYAVRVGFEGVMLKTLSGTYSGKRCGHWVKSKLTDTVDLKVVGFEWGTGKHEGVMGALICEYKGGAVNVGTGFTDEQRRAIAHVTTDGLKIVNLPRVIEVSYQEKTENSLRFPAFVRDRTNDKEV